MHKYRLLGRRGEGTFSEVLKAQHVKTGREVAIKQMKSHFDSVEQVNSLREVQALHRLSRHPNVVNLHEILFDQQSGRLAPVFELLDMNFYEVMKARKTPLQEEKIKNYLFQLLQALDHMHRHGIFHRDIKPENILIKGDTLKLCDFGSCRGVYSKMPFTSYISTRWYRAPECLLTDGYYSYKMDTWAVGCVAFEAFALYPLFPGTNEADQIDRIHKVLGTPSQQVLRSLQAKTSHMLLSFVPQSSTSLDTLIPHCSSEAIDLIEKLLIYDPEERLSARQALRHPYFKELRAIEKQKRLALKSQEDSVLTDRSHAESRNTDIPDVAIQRNKPVKPRPEHGPHDLHPNPHHSSHSHDHHQIPHSLNSKSHGTSHRPPPASVSPSQYGPSPGGGKAANRGTTRAPPRGGSQNKGPARAAPHLPSVTKAQPTNQRTPIKQKEPNSFPQISATRRASNNASTYATQPGANRMAGSGLAPYGQRVAAKQISSGGSYLQAHLHSGGRGRYRKGLM